MPFEFVRCNIPDIILIKPAVFSDERGFFMESYKASDFMQYGVPNFFVQDNYSCSNRGILRGLHFQLGDKAQGKLVRVSKGCVLDVAVDIRLGSATFGACVMKELSASNHHMLWVPPGFAHGFLTMEDETHLHYKCSHNEYSPEAERALAWNDGSIQIAWPDNIKPILSTKDISQALSLTQIIDLGVC